MPFLTVLHLLEEFELTLRVSNLTKNTDQLDFPNIYLLVAITFAAKMFHKKQHRCQECFVVFSRYIIKQTKTKFK